MLLGSPARVLAFPFVIYGILFFSLGWYDSDSLLTLIFVSSIIILVLIYVFQFQINEWYWKRNMPSLSPKLQSWLRPHSTYYLSLDPIEQELFERRVSLFMKVKSFTVKGSKDYELEEDTKCLISHEFQRLAKGHGDFLYEQLGQIIVYNHPFATPKIASLHAIEIDPEDGVIILSREQLINGFFDSSQVNIGLLGAIMTFVAAHPRLDYPHVELSPDKIVEIVGLSLSNIYLLLGVDHINKLDLLIYVYVQYPQICHHWDAKLYNRLEAIFGLRVVLIQQN